MTMKRLRRDLQSVVRSLKLLTGKMDKIAQHLESIEKPLPAKKRVAKSSKRAATKKTSSPTATDKVLKIIKGRKKGIDTATLKEKTNFDMIRVRNIIFRLKKQGKIETKSRGIYVAV